MNTKMTDVYVVILSPSKYSTNFIGDEEDLVHYGCYGPFLDRQSANELKAWIEQKTNTPAWIKRISPIMHLQHAGAMELRDVVAFEPPASMTGQQLVPFRIISKNEGRK